MVVRASRCLAEALDGLRTLLTVARPVQRVSSEFYRNYSEDEEEEYLTTPRNGECGTRRYASNALPRGDRLCDSKHPQCCICLGEIKTGKDCLLLPCAHNGIVHTSCAWEWVCINSSSDPDAGVFHITCPMCRSSETTRLVSYADLHGQVQSRPPVHL